MCFQTTCQLLVETTLAAQLQDNMTTVVWFTHATQQERSRTLLKDGTRIDKHQKSTVFQDIVYKEMGFHHSGFICVSLNFLLLRQAYGIDCKEMVFRFSVFLSVTSNFILVRKIQDINCKEMIFRLSVVLSVTSNLVLVRNTYDIDCKEMGFHRNVLLNVPSNNIF